jgi:hypothetical protein
MKITLFTVIICVFASASLIRLLWRVARDGMALRSALVWIIMWLSLAVFSIFPDLLNHLVTAAGMEDRLSFLLITAVLALTALLFNLTSRVDRMHRDVGLAIREIAVANYRIDSLKREEERAGASEPLENVASGPRNATHDPIGNDISPMSQHLLDHGG